MSLFVYAGPPDVTYPFLPLPGGSVAPVTVNPGDVVDLDPDNVPADGHWTAAPPKAKATTVPDNERADEPAPAADTSTSPAAQAPAPSPVPDAAPATPAPAAS